MKRIAIYGWIVLMLSACSGTKNNNSSSDSEDRAEPVEVMKIVPQTVARDVEYTSTILAWEELHYAPATPGRIDKIYVEVGQRVRKGELLAQMDLTQLQQAEVQLSNLELDFARIDTLNQVGSIARQQYDQIKTQLDITRSNVKFLRENTRLLAPFSGLISGKYYESGEMYTGTPSPTVGKSAILSLVQIDRLKLKVSISEKYFPLIKNGMTANVVVDVYPDREFTGKVFNIYPTIDPASRSFIVEVAVDNSEALLRPGMFARVGLDLDKEEAILLPSISVLKLQGSNDRYLFIAENGFAKRIPVKLGKRYNELVEVISDELKEGDNLVIRGQARLLDGMRLEVK